MKLKAVSSVILPPADVERDFQGARDIGKVRLGQQCLYFTKFSGTSYLPYSAVKKAWLRQEEVNAGMCCGRLNFDQFFLVVEDENGKTYKSEILSKDLGKNALSHIAAINPAIEIGYKKPETVS